MDNNELPLGFSFALAQNPDAMMHYSRLSQSEQAQVLQKARAAGSKAEMRSIVNNLAAQG